MVPFQHQTDSTTTPVMETFSKAPLLPPLLSPSSSSSSSLVCTSDPSSSLVDIPLQEKDEKKKSANLTTPDEAVGTLRVPSMEEEEEETKSHHEQNIDNNNNHSSSNSSTSNIDCSNSSNSDNNNNSSNNNNSVPIRQRKKSRVQFYSGEPTSIRYIPSKQEMTDEDREKIWLQRSELKRIRKECILYGRVLRRGGNGLDDPSLLSLPDVRQFLSKTTGEKTALLEQPAPHGEEVAWLSALGQSSRGLECYTFPDLEAAIRQDRYEITHAILLAQRVQRAKESNNNCMDRTTTATEEEEGNDGGDNNVFATIAEIGSRRSREVARVKAFHDSIAACQYYDEENRR